MKEILSRLKMKRMTCAFVDKVNGKEVFEWTSIDGSYMAQSRFGFRVKIKQ